MSFGLRATITFLFIILSASVVKLYFDQQELKLRLQAPQSDQAIAQVHNPEQSVRESWSHVQSHSRDTVVQVFTQVAELDLLTPYKLAKEGQVFGSGFFINETGEIVTNAHVVHGAKSVWVQIPSLGKTIIDVEIVGVCPDRDLALLKLTKQAQEFLTTTLGKIPYLSLGNSDNVFRSDEVLALGYPLGQYSLKSTTGVVSGREHVDMQHFIQISAPINPGSSGGPSLNHQGQVVGVNTGVIQNAQNVGYIIPINELKIILDDLRKVRLLRRPFLGIRYVQASNHLTSYLKNPEPGGCYAIEIYKNSLLDKAGVKSGDMIYEIDGHKIDIFGDMNVPWSEDKISLTDYTSRLKLGQDVKLVLYRKGQKKVVNIKFDLKDELPIRIIYPDFEKVDYEIIGGMVITQLTLNHVAQLINAVPDLAEYAQTPNQQHPALILTHIFPNSQAHRCRALTIGSIITEVNDQQVKTLADFRDAVKKDLSREFLTIKTKANSFVAFPYQKILSEEVHFAREFQYPLTAFSKELMKIPNRSHEVTS